jgi:hypothetical protein
VERDAPFDPVNLAIDKSGNLIVQSSFGAEGTVYAFKPGTPMDQMTVIPATVPSVHAGARALIPGRSWTNARVESSPSASKLRGPPAAPARRGEATP